MGTSKTDRGRISQIGIDEVLRRNQPGVLLGTSLTRLKWLGVAGPVTILGVAAIVAHFIYPRVLDSHIGAVAVVVVISVAAFFFSQVIFGLVHRLEERIVDQNRELEALSTVADALSRTLELPDALQISLDSTMDAVGASAGVICILDREATELYSAAHRGLSPAVLEHVRRQKIVPGSLEAQVVFDGRPVVINNAFDDPRTAEICRREGYRSTISVPLKHGGEAVGVLAMAGTAEAAFGDTDRRLLEAIGEQVAVAIEKSILFRDLTQTNRNLATLNTVSDVLSTTLELDDVIERALHAVLRSIDADVAQIWLLKRGTVASSQVATRSGGRAADVSQQDAYEICQVISDKQPKFPDNGSCCPGCRQIAPGETDGLGVLACIPLKSGADLVGVLRLFGDKAGGLHKRQREVLQGAAAQVGVAIKNAQLYEQVQELSILEERDRIAREMHDGLAQVLGYVNAKAFAVRKLLASGRVTDAENYLAELEEAARDVYADVREDVLGLRTQAVRYEGLAAGLATYLDKYSRLSGVRVNCEVDDGVDDLNLPGSADLQVLRIIQEALSNVRKHSRATEATVELRMENESLLVLVEDRGHGFSADRAAPDGRPRFGLQTMRERAESVGGTFKIVSQRGAGTTIHVSIPLGDARDGSQRLRRTATGARAVSTLGSSLDDEALED